MLRLKDMFSSVPLKEEKEKEREERGLYGVNATVDNYVGVLCPSPEFVC